jgi:hypothetical protein
MQKRKVDKINESDFRFAEFIRLLWLKNSTNSLNRLKLFTVFSEEYCMAYSTRRELTMERIRTINHKGKKVMCCDFSGFDIFKKDELQALIDQAKKIISKEPPHSVLMLTVVTKLKFDLEIIKIFKEYTDHNKPFIKASAITGIAGLLNIALNSVVKSALRDIHTFDTETLALDWLAEQ